jgi:putative alpha-1,2-mannosidase
MLFHLSLSFPACVRLYTPLLVHTQVPEAVIQTGTDTFLTITTKNWSPTTLYVSKLTINGETKQLSGPDAFIEHAEVFGGNSTLHFHMSDTPVY